MAKRRKLEAPDPNELAEFEARFRGETRPGPVAPIGALAADSAAASDPRDAEARETAERHRAAAEAFADARGRGLVLEEVPLDLIDAHAMIRDRAVIDEAELLELRDSISRHGLRLPIEIYERQDPQDGRVYGLLSGYRRLLAVRQLHEMTEMPRYARIRAILRDPEAMGGTFTAMVEENEVRAGLSLFERGRIAVIAAGQGAFANVEAAVDALFVSASKAKRSKVRSFALIFEELGDLLAHPEAMKETQGLRLATALRNGAEPALRAALEARRAGSFEEEWALMEPVLARNEAEGRDPTRGGRPRRTPAAGADLQELSSGLRLGHRRDRTGATIRVEGPLDDALLDSLMAEIAALLSRPDR